jgi:hypothetical protein
MCIWSLTPQLEILRLEFRNLWSLDVHYNLHIAHFAVLPLKINSYFYFQQFIFV